MDKKIEEFLEEIAAGTDAETYNAIVKDAMSMDTESFLKTHMPMIEKDPSLSLAAKKMGIDKLGKSKWDRYNETFGSSDKTNPFKKDEGWLKAVHQEDYPDIDYETFKNDIDKMSNFWETEKFERESQAGKTRRKKEVEKDWPWYKKLLANEYSQAKYIDDPNKTPFGKEGKFDYNLPEMANIGLQGLSYAGDAIPGIIGYAAGPGVRLANDVVQKNTTPYGKDIEDILRDRALDVGTSFLGEAGPNAILRMLGRSEKLSKKLLQPIDEAVDYNNLVARSNKIKQDLKTWASEPDYARRNKIAEQIPDEHIKTALTDVNMVDMKPETREGVISNFNREIIPNDEAVKRFEEMKFDTYERPRKGGGSHTPPENFFWIRDVANTPTPPKWASTIVNSKDKLPVKLGTTFIERKTAGSTLGNPNFTQPESENDRKVIDWYKENYAKDWDMGFKPKENAGLLYQAWKEYKGIE
jgi:hypothetical protein